MKAEHTDITHRHLQKGFQQRKQYFNNIAIKSPNTLGRVEAGDSDATNTPERLNKRKHTQS